jgi:hypothetical protein
VLFGLSLAEFFQHADFAVGLDQGLAAAFDLGCHRLPLLGKALLLRLHDQLVPLSFDEPVDLDISGRDLHAAKLQQDFLFPLQAIELPLEHVVDAVGLGQRGPALVAP